MPVVLRELSDVYTNNVSLGSRQTIEQSSVSIGGFMQVRCLEYFMIVNN